jgi:GT2 family glycosyltransferase
VTKEATCVVVAFHRPALLQRLLERLTHPLLELIVVNVEDDPAVRQLSGADIISMPINKGYAAGVNLGSARAATAVTAFMNDDVSVSAADILKMAARVKSGESDVVVPLVRDEMGELELARRTPYRLARRMQLKGEPVPDGPTLIDAAWAVVVTIRTDLLRAVPMPEDYFLYAEEFEWFYRLHQREARVELLPDVRILHYGGTKVIRPEKSRLMARNHVRCVRRTRGRGAALRVWPRVVGWQSRVLVTSVLRGQGGMAFRAHAAGVRAAVMAWREI